MTTQPYVNFFQEHIVHGVQYWTEHEAVQAMDIPVLDEQRENILKAMSLGLGVAEAWPSLYPLIVAFASYMERRGHWDVWHRLLQRAIATAQSLEDLDGEITLTALLARVCQRQSQPRATVWHYRRVIRLARQTGNRFEEARACSNLGYLYIDGGHWWRSEVLSCHALKLFEALGSEHGQAHTHNHLGLLYTRRQKWMEAKHHLTQACEFWQVLNDEHSLASSFQNLGILYCDKKEPSNALNFLNKALSKAQQTGEEEQLGPIWNNMGIAYRQAKEFNSSLVYAKKAEEVFLHFSNMFGLARVWGNLGFTYLEKEENKIALKYFKKSWEMHKLLNDEKNEADALIQVIKCNLALNNYSQALFHLNDLEVLVLSSELRPYPDLISQLNKLRYSLDDNKM